MENTELKWFNQGESAYLIAVATLAAGILQTDGGTAFVDDTEIAVRIADKVLSKLVTGDLNEV